MRSQLNEVLFVFCTMTDGIPYQQGMSHLAATLLLHLHEPRVACAALSALLHGYPVLRACVSMNFAPSVCQITQITHPHISRDQMYSIADVIGTRDRD